MDEFTRNTANKLLHEAARLLTDSERMKLNALYCRGGAESYLDSLDSLSDRELDEVVCKSKDYIISRL